MKAVIIGQGKMGSLLEQTLKAHGHEVLGKADLFHPEALDDNTDQIDVIIDFSHADNLDWVLSTAKANHIAVVEGTTGLSEEQKQAIEEASKEIPLFFSSNYSLGIALLKQLAAKAAALLAGDWDMEIMEIHHNQKKDAPSGTALSLLEAINIDNAFETVYGRSPKDGPRQKEIGMHSLRGGTIPGTHEVFFFGNDETITLKHEAISRQIFVDGALRAAEFLSSQPDGLYGMDDVIALSLQNQK